MGSFPFNPWQGIFYYPGRLGIPETSIITELISLNPDQLVLLSITPSTEGLVNSELHAHQAQSQSSAVGSDLMIYITKGIEPSVVQDLKSLLYTGAVVSFYHPLGPLPYTTNLIGTIPLPTPSPSTSSILLHAQLAELCLWSGVLPPEQDEKALVIIHKERDGNAILFREIVERRIEGLAAVE